MPVIQTPLGHGEIVWLGLNQERGKFSVPYNRVTINKGGIARDMYCGMWRKVAGHDVDYVATDGVVQGEEALNLRQITIVDAHEVELAGKLSGVSIERGMLRENIAVRFIPRDFCPQFSKLPPLSRMVIGHGKEDSKVLLLTEENGPCRTICNPIAVHLRGGRDMATQLRECLAGRRGQMAMVRSAATREVQIGDSFTIFPPMT